MSWLRCDPPPIISPYPSGAMRSTLRVRFGLSGSGAWKKLVSEVGKWWTKTGALKCSARYVSSSAPKSSPSLMSDLPESWRILIAS